MLSGIQLVAFALEADAVSETYFGLTAAIWTVGLAPVIGFTMVRPVVRSAALDRLISIGVKLLAGVPAFIGLATFALFVVSVMPGGLGWNMQLGSDFVSYAPAMIPSAAGIMLGSLFITRRRATAQEARIVYLAVAAALAVSMLQVFAFFLGVFGFIVATAVPMVVLAMGAVAFTIYRIYSPVSEPGFDPEAPPEDAALAQDPWHALRRV